METQNTEPSFRFDVEKFFGPISPDQPAGTALIYDGTYDGIREARRFDDPELGRGVWQVELKKVNWKGVEDLCLAALEKTRDLQIAAWLMEAWLRLHGVAGAREGFRLLTGLCGNFWGHLHPRSDDGDIEYTFAPIVWVNEKLSVAMRLLPITQPEFDEARPYCWADWEAACRIDNAPLPRGAVPSVTQADFQKSCMQTPTAAFVTLADELKNASDACAQLEAVLAEKAGKDAPSLGQFRATLETIRQFVANTLAQRDVTVGETASAPRAAIQPASPEAATPSSLPEGPILSRGDAYRRLADVASYLSRTEPHSPTPYLIRRAIYWGNMSLEDLLPELVRDSAELASIYQLLQIHRDKADGK